MTLDDRSFEEFGIQVPPGLLADAAEGIHDCIFSEALIEELRESGLKIVRCDQQYLVAVRRDTIGSDFDEQRPRQPLILAALPEPKYTSAYPDAKLISEMDLDPHAREFVRGRFNVGSERSDLRIWALVDPSDRLIGKVAIATPSGTICEFKYSESPLPQSTCFAKAKNTILKLSTNSTDLEAIVSMAEKLSRLSWSR